MSPHPILIPEAFLPARIWRAQELCELSENYHRHNQYSNPANPLAHHQTAKEILEQNPEVDILVVSLSTCGTARGLAEYLTVHAIRRIELVVVDACGSLITDSKSLARTIPGLGAAIAPPHFRSVRPARVYRVTDLESIAGCRHLLKTEGLITGGSTGAAYRAALAEAALRPGSNIVFIAPDRGENYLDTIYDDSWVLEHFRCSITRPRF